MFGLITESFADLVLSGYSWTNLIFGRSLFGCLHVLLYAKMINLVKLKKGVRNPTEIHIYSPLNLSFLYLANFYLNILTLISVFPNEIDSTLHVFFCGVADF